MDFFRGGHVKIRGKRQKLTVAVSLPDDEVEPAKVPPKAANSSRDHAALTVGRCRRCA
jgi:hypothetical protein